MPYFNGAVAQLGERSHRQVVGSISPDTLIPYFNGAVAQLGERLNGIQEVVGSIPISSTIFFNGLRHPI
jgi:hypothetical protein